MSSLKCADGPAAGRDVPSDPGKSVGDSIIVTMRRVNSAAAFPLTRDEARYKIVEDGAGGSHLRFDGWHVKDGKFARPIV